MTRTRLLVGLAVLAFLGAGTWIAMDMADRPDVDRVLAESEATVAQILAEEHIVRRRQATLRPRVEGLDARAIYAEILPAATALVARHAIVDMPWEWEDDDERPMPPANDVAAFVEDATAFLANAQRVLGADVVGPHPSLDGSVETNAEDIPGWQALGRVLDLQARAHAIAGRGRDALDAIEALWQSGADCARGGDVLHHLVGLSLQDTALRTIWRLWMDDLVDGQARNRIRAWLDAPSLRMPDMAVTWRRDEAPFRVTLHEAIRGNRAAADSLAEGGALAQDRLILAVALRDLTGMRERVTREVQPLPAHESRLRIGELVRELTDETSPFLNMVLVVLPTTWQAFVKDTAHRHLLRVALDIADRDNPLGGSPEAPMLLSQRGPDPWSGESLRWDGSRLWSVGEAGHDLGGQTDELMPFFVSPPVGADMIHMDVVLRFPLPALRPFGWHDNVDADARQGIGDRLEAWLSTEVDDLPEGLDDIPAEALGFLISRFVDIRETHGFDSNEGRRQARRLDRFLRALDDHMVRWWWDPEPLPADASPEAIQRTALRWARFWHRDQWRLEE